MSNIYSGWSSSAEAGLIGVLFQVELEFMIVFLWREENSAEILTEMPRAPRSKEENQQTQLT